MDTKVSFLSIAPITSGNIFDEHGTWLSQSAMGGLTQLLPPPIAMNGYVGFHTRIWPGFCYFVCSPFCWTKLWTNLVEQICPRNLLDKTMDKYLLDNFVHFRLSGQILDKYLLDRMILNIKVCCFVLLRFLLNKTEQTTNNWFITLLLCWAKHTESVLLCWAKPEPCRFC